MKLKQLTKLLNANSNLPLHIMLPSGAFVPNHFHVTEVGLIQKTFIDCGGTIHESSACVLQIWTANDVEHVLLASKLLYILRLASSIVTDELEVQIEYGEEIASQYYIANVDETPKGILLELAGKQTDCLAPDKCGINKCGPACC